LDYLDRLFPDELISFIKIDVEGHEEKVLRGGEQLILRSKPVIYFESWNIPEA
jgi:FkbM family methyltransferase